jgi:DNA-damage-inducible protein D
MNDIDVFNPKNKDNFETLSHENGNVYWLASDYARWLDYADFKSFHKALNKAIGVCMSLKIDIADNFQEMKGLKDGKSFTDYKLTRFACYLIAMNADVKKKPVARAQVYFASLAELIRQSIENAENVERVLVRQELTDRNLSLQGIAKMRGVENYAFFVDAGYRGMYNMGAAELRRIKGITNPRQTPFDFMGKRELAANLFRVTETEGRIRDKTDIKGQEALENVAYKVGREVRNIMEVKPEILAQDVVNNIKEVQSNIKEPAKALLN